LPGSRTGTPVSGKLAREYGLVDMTAEEISRMQSLITNLHSKEQRVRQDAIFGISQMGPNENELILYLLELLESGNGRIFYPDHCRKKLSGLGMRAGDKTGEEIAEALISAFYQRNSQTVRDEIKRAMLRLGKPAVQPLWMSCVAPLTRCAQTVFQRLRM